jgi:sugar phosphate isomerase/epimerase
VRLSCLPVSYFGGIRSGEMSVGQWARQAAEIGFDSIDLSILFLENCGSAELAAMRWEIEAAGMYVAVVTTYPDFTHPSASERERQLSKLAKDVASCAAVGAEMVRITAGQAHPETSRREGIEWVTDAFRRSTDTAERCGVQLVYENHSKPGIWQYSDFSHPSDLFLEIADAIEDLPIGILFDTANPIAREEDPVSLLKKMVSRVVCVHASDTGVRGALRPVVVGTGLVPFDEIMTVLKCAGYDGLISIEEASGTGEAGVQSAFSFVANTWADII